MNELLAEIASSTPAPTAWLEIMSQAVDIFARVVGFAAALVAALWVYAKFIVERGLLPATQFSLSCEALGMQQESLLVEVTLRLKNLGSSTLIVKDTISVRIRYLRASDRVTLVQGYRPRVAFPHVVGPIDPLKKKSTHKPGRTPLPPPIVPNTKTDTSTHDKPSAMINLSRWDTFVQPGVEQLYPLVVALPSDATYVLVHGRFDYAQRPKPIERAFLRLSRSLGLVQFSLVHLSEDHTAERAFMITPSNGISGAEHLTQP